MFEQFNQFEKDIIRQFSSHPFFAQLESMPWQAFLEVLMQRRFLSLHIVNTYEAAIDALEDREAIQVVRTILHEEYPRNTSGRPLPSHRELLMQDLLSLGATKADILGTVETETTRRIRLESVRQFTHNLASPDFEVGAIAGLRFWSEVLVGIEYRGLWPKLAERLSRGKDPAKPRSEFYYFHMMHDARGTDVGKEELLGGLTHSQELGLVLKRLVQSPAQLDYCMEIERGLLCLKYEFYDQFLPDDSSLVIEEKMASLQQG